jgi:hypothetical protein
MKAIALVMALALAPMGCASTLLLRDTDTAGQKAGKVVGTVGLTIISLGFAQIVLGRARRIERRKKEAEAHAEAKRAWEWSMDGARTMGEITKLFGSAPDACHSSSTEMQICTWTLGRERMEIVWGINVPRARARRVGWEATAVCELPKDGSPRASDSCQLAYE